MPPTIGSEDFITMEGTLNHLGEVVQDISRPGIDGHAARKLGRKAAEATVRTFRDVEDAAAAKARSLTYLNLRGSVVAVIDGLGNFWTNVLIQDVRVDPPQRTVNPVGGLEASPGKFVVPATWTLRLLQDEVP